jgi:hypothetical protein
VPIVTGNILHVGRDKAAQALTTDVLSRNGLQHGHVGLDFAIIIYTNGCC